MVSRSGGQNARLLLGRSKFESFQNEWIFSENDRNERKLTKKYDFGCYQCDQMVRLFSQYLAIHNNEKLPNTLIFDQIWLKMVPNIK